MLSDCIVDWTIWTKPDFGWTFRFCNLIYMSKLFVEHRVSFFRFKKLSLHEKDCLCDFKVRPNNRIFLHFADLDTRVNLFKVSTVISVYYGIFVFNQP